jgi:predicted enzyme related to lactoylglutathione lyase
MALISSDGFAHVRLTVTDIGRSKAFYDQVFGWPIAVDESASAHEPGVTESRERFFGGTVSTARSPTSRTRVSPSCPSRTRTTSTSS